MARGSIIKRGEAWRIAVELLPDPKTGKRRQRWETFRGTKKQAEQRLTSLLAEADQQKLGISSKDTLELYLKRWLEEHAKTKAPKTYLRYLMLVNHQIVPELGKVRLDRLTPTHITGLLAKLRQTPRQDTKGKAGQTLSDQTIQHVFRVLHTALECAVDWEILSRNPMQRLDAPKVERREMRTFTVEQSKAFLAAAGAMGVEWEAFFALAMTTGMRLGETRGLRWADVDLEAGVIRVQQAFQRISKAVRPEGRVFKATKTSGSRRAIALDSDMVALLRRHRVEQNERRLLLGTEWQDFDLVFPSRVGTPLEDKRVHTVFTRICESAGVPRIRPYDLRHACASLLLAAGVNPKVVAERLGHSSVNLTLNTYSHIQPTLQKDAAETLRKLLR